VSAQPIPLAASSTGRQPPAVALHEKEVLDYREAQALGICAERTLRRLMAAGKVVRAVIRNGSRVKFEKAILMQELREAEE